MNPQDYALDIKTRFGDTPTADGRMIRDLSDQEVVQKMVTKYPSERYKIQGIDEFLTPEEQKLIPPESKEDKKTNAFMQRVGDIVRGVGSFTGGNKIGESLGTIGVAGYQALKGNTDIAKNVLDTQVPVPELIGSYTKAATTPLAIATPVGGVARAGLTGAGFSGAFAAGDAMEEGKDAGEVVSDGLKGAALGGALGVGAGAIGKGIQAAGKSGYKLAIPLSAQEAKMMQGYKARVPFWERVQGVLSGSSKAPRVAEETAFKKGFMGTESMLGVQSKRAAKTLWDDVIGKQLKASPTKVRMTDFFDEAERSIVSNNPEVARQKDLLTALQSLRDDYVDVGEITLDKLQDFKKGWAKFVPEKVYKGQPIAGAFNDVKNVLADLARKRIYGALGDDIKLAYLDYGNLEALQELGQKAMTGAKMKGGAGSLLTALKDMVVTPIATIGGQAVYKVGEGIEMIGPKGARFLGEIIPMNE